MLAAHPRLVCGPETHFFDQLGRCDALRPRPPRRLAEKRDRLPLFHRARGRVDPGELRADPPGTRRGAGPPGALDRLDPLGMIDLYTERNGKRRWVEKTPDHLPYVARIRRHYPDSPIVRIVRDPRDVAASLLGVSWGPPTSDPGLALWRGSTTEAPASSRSDPRCHTLRYEDLVLDPEPTPEGPLPVHQRALRSRHARYHRSARLVNAANEAWKAKVAERVDASRVEAWRSSLAGDELRLAEACLGDRLRAYGYPAARPRAPPSRRGPSPRRDSDLPGRRRGPGRARGPGSGAAPGSVPSWPSSWGFLSRTGGLAECNGTYWRTLPGIRGYAGFAGAGSSIQCGSPVPSCGAGRSRSHSLGSGTRHAQVPWALHQGPRVCAPAADALCPVVCRCRRRVTEHSFNSSGYATDATHVN